MTTHKKKLKVQKKEKTEQPIAEPVQREKVFTWMPEHQKAFDTLKEALVTALVLGYPDLLDNSF